MPYVSGQTMTLNDAQLVNKMYKQTTQSRKNTECRVVISIDFEKFNQRWRRESIHRVTTLCDQWFGTNNFFSFVHDFFDNAFFYLCSSYEPPENLRKEWLKKDERTFLSLHPEYKDNRCKDGSSLAHLESKTTWEGQAGAGEGLWQKGWTIAIIGALHAVEYKTGIHSSIMGQGDNQVIVVSWEIPFPDLDQETYIRDHGNLFQEVIDRYLTELTRIVNGMGMKVKLEETWVSTKFLSYGKEAWFNGVYMTSVMKRVGRTFQEVNDIHPTFANRLGSVFSTGYSCATKDYNQIIPYLLAIMEAASMLRTETVNSPINGSRIKSVLSRANITVTEDIILCALLLPKEFGGFPCIPFTEFLFRGHPDPVTSGLYWLKICAKYLPEVKKILTWISSRDGINETVKDTDIERLIQDPVCLNFRSFGQYSSEVARQLEGNLRTHVKNRQLRILFSRDTTNYRTKMIKYLDSIHPCFPRILNEVLRISPLGAQQAFLAQFRDIKTLKNLMGVQDGSILVDLIRDGDIKNVVGVLSLVKKILSNESKIIRDFPHSYREKVKEDWECTTMLADRLREASWGRPVMGSTTPYPQEQFKAHKTTTYPSCPTTAKEHILAILIPSNSKHSISGTKYPYNHQLSRGHMPAYTGSITSEKRTTGLISFQKSENGARATQRALHLKNWVFHSEGTVKHLLEDIVESRCDIPVDTLESLIGEHYGGSMTHRFRCVMLKHTQAPNMRPNISTHVQLSSDRMGIYSRGFDNYTMLFQSIYLTIYANLANLEILSEDLKTSAQIAYHYHVNCLGCCQLVEDIPLYTDLPKPRMPDFKKCPLVYTKCDEVVQKSSWVFDKRLTLKRPSPIPSENLPYSIHACAFIVLGMNEQANALTLVGDSRQPDKIRYDHTISIGVIIRLGIENVIKTVSELWCLCYYEDLVHMTKGTSLNIESVLGYMLNRSTTGLWDSLKPLILIPEIADRLVKMTNLKPNNVKAFFSGEGLDSYLSLLSKRYIQDWITSGYKPPVVLTPAKNMPIMRLVRIWSVATVLNRLHADPIRMKKVLLKLGPLLRSCWKDGTFDSNYWHISWASFAKAEFEVSSSDKSIWPPLSEVSAETWLKPINMPVQCDPSRIDPIVSLQLWKSYMMCVLSQKAVFSIELEHMNNETLREQSIERTLKNLQTSIMEEFSMSVNQLKSREDHQYRLVGVHSTAPLKYIEIFARAGVINVEESMHIAEGAGGVANLAHRLNNSSMVYYNSLMDVKESISHRFGVFVPPSLLDVNSKFKLIGPQKCVETGGDITSPEVLEYYCNLMKSSNNIDLLTCDAETSGQFSVDIAINITMSVARLSSHMMPGRKVIYKTFCHSKTLLALQCQILSGTLRDLTIMVPCFSSHESYEVFIVGSVRQDPWFCSGRIRTNDNLVESLNILTELEDRYQPDHPFQRRYPLLVESSLALCKYIGLECNKPHAMSALTGGFLDDQTYPSNNSRLKIYKTQEEIKSGMVLKLKALTEKKSGHRMVAERDLLYKEAKLKLEFQVITEYHLNLQLMNYLLSHKTLSDIQWSQNYSIYQDGILLFSIELNRTAWWARYAKHWQKLIGHVSRDTTFQPLPLLPGRCTNVVTFVYWVRYQVKSTTGFNYLTYIGNCSLLYNSPLHTYPLALGDWRPGPAHRPFRPRPAAGRSGGVIP